MSFFGYPIIVTDTGLVDCDVNIEDNDEQGDY